MNSITDTSDNATLKRCFTYENGKEKENQITQEDQNQGAKKCDNLEKKTETAEEKLANAKIKFQELDVDYTNSTNDVAIANDELEDLKEQKKEAKQEDKSKFKTDIDKAKDKLKSAKQKQREAKKLKAEAKLSVTKLSAVAKKESDNIKKLEAEQKSKAKRLEDEARAKKLEDEQKAQAQKLEDEAKARAKRLEEAQTRSNKYDYLDFEYKTLENKTIGCEENLVQMLDHLGIEVRYDETTRKHEFSGTDIDSNDMKDHMLAIKNDAKHVGYPHTHVEDNIRTIAKKNSYYKSREFLECRQWDGNTRIRSLINTVKLKNQDQQKIFEVCLFKWLLSAVAAQYASDRGIDFFSKGLLIFQGGQNVGKSSWFNKLMPKEYKALAKPNRKLLNLEDKDNIIKLTSCMIVEIAEFDGSVAKNSDSDMKTFISSYEDEFRRPYGIDNVSYPRRTVFFGSVNPESFLKDVTGNSRYWCFSVEALNYTHDIDMYQLWAEIKYIYDVDFPQWWLNEKESALLAESNMLFETSNSIQEYILYHFDPDAPKKDERYTATDVIRLINNAEGFQVVNPSKANQIGKVLAKYFETRTSNGSKKYLMPEKLCKTSRH